MSYPLPNGGAVSVSELNRAVHQLIEQAFPLLWVAGEVSNLTRAASGHWYFTLKDAGAQVRCAMFRHKNQYLDWVPENGMQVEVRAEVTLYEPRGEYQLNVEAMRRAGFGALFEAFEKLKAKLGAEGLFEAERKRPLPAFPKRIGIITSPDAAALRDVLTTLARRMPSLPIVLYPTPVQGDGAALKIAQAVRAAGERAECDVLILCRGGGSIEDLWQFNEEAVARAVAECPIPVVSGVGHETDFTITDFVADRRAPTPTAAAEMVSPNREELAHRLGILGGRLERRMEALLEQRMQQVDYLARRLVHPGERLQNQGMHLEHLGQRLASGLARTLDASQWRYRQAGQRLASAQPDLARRQAECLHLGRRLEGAMGEKLHRTEAALQRLGANLVHLNPMAVLKRGYSLVETAEGKIVTDSTMVDKGDALRLTFAKGWAEARVEDKA